MRKANASAVPGTVGLSYDTGSGGDAGKYGSGRQAMTAAPYHALPLVYGQSSGSPDAHRRLPEGRCLTRIIARTHGDRPRIHDDVATYNAHRHPIERPRNIRRRPIRRSPEHCPATPVVHCTATGATQLPAQRRTGRRHRAAVHRAAPGDRDHAVARGREQIEPPGRLVDKRRCGERRTDHCDIPGVARGTECTGPCDGRCCGAAVGPAGGEERGPSDGSGSPE